MAIKYWVGGAGDWDSSTNWSTSSGGSRNTSPPSTSDLAVFDANSGSGTVYLQVNAYIYCGGLKVTSDCNININGTTGNYALLVYTDVTNTTTNSGYCVRVERNMTQVNLGLYKGSDGAGTHGVYVEAPVLKGFSLNGDFSGTTISLGGNITAAATGGISFNVSGGNFNSNGYSMTSFGSFSAGWSGAGTCNFTNSALYGGNGFSFVPYNASATMTLSNNSINSGSGTLQLILSSGTLNVSNVTGTGATLTISGGTFSGTNTFSISGTVDVYSSTSISGAFSINKTSSGTQSFNIQATGVSVVTAGGGELILNASASLSSLTVSSSYQNTISLDAALSVSGSLTITGAVGLPQTVKSSTTPAKTLTSTSYSLNNIRWQNITAAGTIPFTGTEFVDLGGNTNIQFYVHRPGLFFGNNF